MKILALEFSSNRRSVAALDSASGALGVAREDGGRAIAALAEQALRQAGIEREEIEVVAVGLGPGSYTGIRGALAFAQGWSIGRGVRLLGVSSMDCLAARAQEEKWFGPINLVIDAQRNEFYLARFDIRPDGLQALEPLRLAGMAEIETLPRDIRLAGPDVASALPRAEALYPDAATLAPLAAAGRVFAEGVLEPIYLRAIAFQKAPAPRTVGN